MILFVFEGRKTEHLIFKTLEYLYFPSKIDGIICCFGYNIYELYRRMKADNDRGFEEDIVSIIRDKLANRDDNPLKNVKDTSSISEIYLFFDYDFQNTQLSPDELDKRINELFKFFNDDIPDENISLYISYPMVESIRCTGKLPDADFLYYEVSREDSHNFKRYAAGRFKFYGSLDFITLPLDKETGKAIAAGRDLDKIKENWGHLKKQNIEKANYICTGNRGLPKSKDDVRQASIFENQIEKYVKPKDSVAILNAFPLFLYEYFRDGGKQRLTVNPAKKAGRTLNSQVFLQK